MVRKETPWRKNYSIPGVLTHSALHNPTSLFSTTFDGSDHAGTNTVFRYTWDYNGFPLTGKMTKRYGRNQIIEIEDTYRI